MYMCILTKIKSSNFQNNLFLLQVSPFSNHWKFIVTDQMDLKLKK